MKFKRMLAALLGLCMMAAVPAPAAAAEPAVTGDVDGSGDIGLLDAVCLQKFLLGQGTLPENGDADVNEDHSIDIFDLGMLKRWLMNGVQPNYTAEKATRNVRAAAVKGLPADDAYVLAQTDFAVRLLQQTAKDGKNTLLSPYSVMQALSMTANGAANNTLTQMEQTLGGIPMDELNRYNYTLRTTLPDEPDSRFLTANSIWVNQVFPVSDTFLQTDADYYAADVFYAPFDETTVRDINRWTDNNTDHMIPHLINTLDPDNDMLALVNAVTFDAKWMCEYDSEYSVHDSVFTAADGTKQDARMMYSEERNYLSDEHATGFMKHYCNGRYAFAAILPEEGMTTGEYIAGMTGESLHKLLAGNEKTDVHAALPKFSYSYDVKLNEPLSVMGMPDAFSDTEADFSRMNADNLSRLYIGYVLHKTDISVTESGTRAAAATIVLMAEKGEPMEFKTVTLDRPFVYCIVDTETMLPLFIGTVESL